VLATAQPVHEEPREGCPTVAAQFGSGGLTRPIQAGLDVLVKAVQNCIDMLKLDAAEIDVNRGETNAGGQVIVNLVDQFTLSPVRGAVNTAAVPGLDVAQYRVEIMLANDRLWLHERIQGYLTGRLHISIITNRNYM
jgi:hypothetical protein